MDFKEIKHSAKYQYIKNQKAIFCIFTDKKALMNTFSTLIIQVFFIQFKKGIVFLGAILYNNI